MVHLSESMKITAYFSTGWFMKTIKDPWLHRFRDETFSLKCQVDYKTRRKTIAGKICQTFQSHVASRLNTLRPRQNGRQIPDYNLKCIFMNENI